MEYEGSKKTYDDNKILIKENKMLKSTIESLISNLTDQKEKMRNLKINLD